MKKLNLDLIFLQIIKYIKVICFIIIVIEMIIATTTAISFTKAISEETKTSATREIENQLDIAWKLGKALVKDEVITDSSIDVRERIQGLDKYLETYNLFLIGLTDEDGIITSTYADKIGDIGYRDYFQYSMTTGETVVTDAFPAGADESVLNYTICIPYYDQETTPAGALIMSISFDDINEIIIDATDTIAYNFTLLDSSHKVMSEKKQQIIGMDFETALDESSFISLKKDHIMDSIQNEESGSYWTVSDNRLLYVCHAPIESTQWTLVIATSFFSLNNILFILTFVEILLIFLIFVGLAVVGKRFMNVKLADTRSMLLQMDKLRSDLLEEKLISTENFEELFTITKSGLLDNLTNLPTRMSIKKMIEVKLKDLPQHSTSVFLLIDLDDLKPINDTYGHIAGDSAISYFSKALKQWSEETDALIGRFGGDEFVAFFTSEDYHNVMNRLQSLLRIEFVEEGSTITLHASIGGAICDTCELEFGQLYIIADKALYNAKNNGKDCYFFSDDNSLS